MPQDNEKETVRQMEVINSLGLHARPSAMLVQLANQFDAELFVSHDGQDEVNAKSIMGVMMLAAGQGASLRFRALGSDGEIMLDAIDKLLQTKFNED